MGLTKVLHLSKFTIGSFGAMDTILFTTATLHAALEKCYSAATTASVSID